MDRRTDGPTDRRTVEERGLATGASRPGSRRRPLARIPWRLAPGLWSLAVRLCVGASVAGAVWGCGNTKPDATAAVEAVADTADQVLFGLKQYVTDHGVAKAYLEADTAFLFENAGKADLRKVRVTFFGTQGDTSSVVTGKFGSYDWRTGKMEARENVVVHLSNGGVLTTSVLRYDQTKNEVSTDQHYVYTGPPDQNMVGENFVTDPSLTMFRTGRPRGRAGSFRLPGQ